MTPQEEAAFEKRAEKHFRSHRPTPSGRNVWAWELRHNPSADRKYKKHFDSIFPDAPGAGI